MNTERLKQARESANLTQLQTAKLLGISDGTYKNYEQGKREPNNTLLVQIADLFGVTTDYLLGRTEPAKQPNPILQLTNEEMEQRLLAAYFKLPKNVRETFIQGMADELSKRDESPDLGAMTHSATIRERMEAANETKAKNGA